MESKGLTYFCGVDGSVMAEIACDMALKDLQRDNDKVVIGHIYDMEKTYLPMKMRAHHIRTNYETKIICHDKKDCKYAAEERSKERSAKD